VIQGLQEAVGIPLGPPVVGQVVPVVGAVQVVEAVQAGLAPGMTVYSSTT
jgi:hypothetical protein